MRLKLSLLLVFIITYSWSQSGSTKTFTGNGTFSVPAGVTSINVQAWGGGGSGGGASGAPLLLGRGAAGGGGGAYASNTLLVTPGTTLNVVVASQTAGTSTAGTAGGNTTITGFESSILAAGGSGGSANNAGGPPIGGVGGTIAASAGSIKFAGANGGNGNSWNLLGLLLSSGPGGAGAGLGGAGGTAVSGLILSNGPGNAGSPPGGAGSGAINSALGASQIGGAGAAGRVIISYSCANFSLTSTNATSICASAGTTSSVTITGSSASLPVGTYVVTYNRSSPSATGLTANLTVSTAGTGTFLATGLSTVGSSTITITKLTSESCSSNITSNNTAVVTISAATVGGTVSGGTTICSGATSGVLTLSGHSGSIVKWQSSVSPFTTWTDIANTTATYTSGILTETTQFRAVVQNGVFCAALNSTATEVTVIPRPTITISSDANPISCSNDDERFPRFTYSATTGSPVTYSITWNQSPPNSFVTVTDESLSPESIQISVPANTAAGTYTGTVTVKNANGCVSLGATFNVNVIDPPSITTTGIIDEINTSTSSQNALLSYTASANNPVDYRVIWDSDAIEDQYETSFNFSSSGGVINTIVIPANTPAGTYTGILIIGDSSVFCTSVQSISITINALPTIESAAAATTVCSSPTIQTTGLSYSSRTGSPTTYSIVWDASPANSFAPVIDGALPASPFTIVIPAGTAAGTYAGTLTVKNATGAVSSPGSVFTVTVNPSPTITITQSEFNVCAYNNNIVQTVEIPYSGTTGSPDTFSIVWDSSPANNLPEITDRELFESPISFLVSHLAEGVYTGTLMVKNANGCVSSSSVITINAVPIPTLTTTGIVDPVCSSAVTQNAVLPYSASANNPTIYSIDWDDEAFADQDNTPFSFVSSGGVINNIQVPANVPAGSYSGTIFISDGNCDKSYPISILINAPPTITLTQTEFNACSYNGFNQQPVELAYSNTTGSPLNYSIVWDASSPNNSFANVINEVLPDSPIEIEIPEGTIAGTYTGILTVKNAAGCVSSNSSFYIHIQESPTITSTGQIDPVNQSTSAQNASLTYSGVTGNPTSYSLIWGLQSAHFFVSQLDIPYTFVSTGGVINNIEVPANVPPGSYSGTLFVIDGTCFGVLPVTITVNALPTIALASSAADICPDVHFFVNSTTLSYSATTGNPVTYSIVWNASPANSFSEITDVQLPDSPITINVPVSTNADTYTGTLTVKDANGNASLGSVFTLKVNQLVNISAPGFVVSIDPVNTSNSPQTTTLTYDSTTGNPTSYSIDWNDQANIHSLADQPITSFAFAPNGGVLNNIEISADVLPGTYQGRLRIYGEICETSIPVSIEITEPAPTIQIAPATNPVCSNINAQTTKLAVGAITGSPTTYSILWNASPANTFADVTDATLVYNTSFIIDVPAGTVVGTYTGILTVKNANGVESSGNSFTVTVNQSPTLTTIGIINSACSSNNAQSKQLRYTASGGSPTSYSIDWNQAANDALLEDKPTTSLNFTPSGGFMIITIEANVLPGTYSGTIVVNNAFCSASYPISITVTTGLVGGTVTGGTTISSGSTSGLLTLSGTTSLVNRWQSSVSPFTTWTNIVNGTTTYTSGPLTETTQFRAVVQGGTCFAVNSEPTTVTVLSAFAKSNSDTSSGITDLESAEKVTSVTAFNQVIHVEAFDQIINQVFVYDVSGNLLYKKNAVSDSKLVISSLRSSNQVLVVKVVLNDNRIATKKVIY